jgi:hypothetical protein
VFHALSDSLAAALASLAVLTACILVGRALLTAATGRAPAASLCFIAGAAFAAVARWGLFLAGVTVSPNLLAAGLCALAAALCALASRQGWRPFFPQGWRDLGPLAATFGVTAFCVFLYLHRIPDGNLPLYTLGNNDLFYFLTVSNALFTPLEVVSGFPVEYARELNQDVFGVFALFGYLAGFFKHNVSAAPAYLGVAAGAYFIALLDVLRAMRAGIPLAASLAALFFSTFLFYFISGHFFAGQMLSWSVLLALAALFAGGEDCRKTHFAASFCIYAFLLFYYPSFALPLMCAHAFLIAFRRLMMLERLAQAFSGRFILECAVDLLAFLTAPAALALLIFFHRAGFALGMVSSQAGGSQGWALPLLSPGALLGLPGHITQAFFESKGQKLAAYALLMAGFGTISVRMCLGRRDAKTPLCTLSALYAMLLCMYAAYYALAGDGYKHWKLATFVLFPLSFVPLLCLSRLAALKRPALFAPLAACLSLALALANLSTTHFSGLTRSAAIDQPSFFSGGYLALERVNADAGVTGICLKLDSFPGAMLALNQLKSKPVYSVDQTYFASTPPDRLPSGDGVRYLSNGRCLAPSNSAELLGDVFALSAGAFAEQRAVRLGKPYPVTAQGLKNLCFSLGGFIYNEVGAWQAAPAAFLDFELPGAARASTVTLAGSAFTTERHDPIVVDVALNGHFLTAWTLAGIALDSEITVALPSALLRPGENRLTFTARNSYRPDMLLAGMAGDTFYSLILKNVRFDAAGN